MGQITSNNKHSLDEQVWHLAFATEQWQPCNRQDQCGFQEKQNYHWMVTDIELEQYDQYATGHEMSNQQSEKQSFPNTTQNWIALGKLVPTYSLAASLFCTASRTSLDDGCNQLCCTRPEWVRTISAPVTLQCDWQD